MLTVVLSAVVSLSVAAITVWLSLRRHRSEQWWERKAEAYSRIVNALHDLAEQASLRAESELGDRYTDAEVKRRTEAGNNAWIELQRATEVGAFVISTEAAGALKSLRSQTGIDVDEGDWYALYSRDHAAYSRALAELRSLAKADLGVASRLSGRTRLGVVASGVWLMVGTLAYVVGRASYPSWWTRALGPLYAWEQAPPEPDPRTGIIHFFLPQPDLVGVSLLALVPILLGWLTLWVVPHALAWVRDGFRQDGREP